ncbi:MAG: hypothetical protein K0R38_2015 [Polyangiaceae bacterium]|jgi:hypothetical protein|nr:hypothetical protein [Polyangiaceae bacterium]
MSKKTKRRVKAKALKKVVRRNGTAFGLAALAASGVAAVAMIPQLREQARRLKELVVSRLEDRRIAKDEEHRLEGGRVPEHAH